MLEYSGEIVIFQNLMLIKNKKNYAIKNGKPFILLNNNLGMPIIIPMTTIYHGSWLMDNYFDINKDDIILFDDNFQFKEKYYANINGVTIANQFYYDVVSHLDSETYYNLLKFIRQKFYRLNNNSKKIYDLILEDLILQESVLEEIVNKKSKVLK